MNQSGNDSRPWFKKKRFILPLSVFALLWLSGSLLRGMSDYTNTSGNVALDESAAPIEQTEYSLPDGKWFTDGTYLVGVDIEPGTYRPLEAIYDSCYWEINRAGSNGQDIIANDNVDGGFPTLILQKNQEISTSDCGVFASTELPVFSIQATDVFGDGIWTVGVDIKPGKYKTDLPVNGLSCYWEIDASGTNGMDIIANDNVDGGFPRVTLTKGQDFSSGDCGIWVPDR